jgi:hypothetical protein
MAAEGTGEVGKIGEAGRGCLGERGRIRQAKQIPGGLPGVDLVFRYWFTLVP